MDKAGGDDPPDNKEEVKAEESEGEGYLHDAANLCRNHLKHLKDTL